MATRALDIITIMHALSVLESELGIDRWQAKNLDQERMFGWLEAHREQIAKITGLDAKASRFWEELNKFLTDRKFQPLFDPFDPSMGIGVASVLDKLVHWKEGPGQKVMISTADGLTPGFELPAKGVNVYSVDGYSGSYLVELLTKTDDTLWLFITSNTNWDGLELAELSMDIMGRSRKIVMRKSWSGGSDYPAFAGAQVPMLDFDVEPDISWLIGADTVTNSGEYYFVSQARQQFKMRMDETGARVKVATAIAMERCMRDEAEPLIIDCPFYGWWTQKGLEGLPMAAFFADLDSMHTPAGSLEDL